MIKNISIDLLEPIIVRSFPAGKYEIISGHRRVEACKELGITEVPATIKEMNKDEATTASAKRRKFLQRLLVLRLQTQIGIQWT